ncbi:MAG: amino acid adenylation domain-containing protein [Bacteroidales bacterium]|nr:amino acid adenylation domain-containing protein [Bacteroidales bacterium]
MISPLSQSQLSIYLSCQGLRPEDGNYQQASLYRIPESIPLEKFARALETFVAAHPYLLSTIVMDEGEPRMSTPEESGWKVPVLEVESMEEPRKGFCATMDLNAGKPLFRMEIYKTLEGNYFYADFHHIIFDGASAGIFLRDIQVAYEGSELQKEAFSGADIAMEEDAARNSEAYAEAKEWYTATFAEAADTPSQIIPDVYGQEPAPYRELLIPLSIDAACAREVASVHRYAESILAHAAWGLTLAAWNADTKACFASIWNGRKGANTRNAMSMCVHTIPVLVEASPEQEIADVIQKLNEQTRGIRQRAFYSFADCNRDLGLNASLSLSFQGQFVGVTIPITLDGQKLEAEDLRTNPPGMGLSSELFSSEEGPWYIRWWYRPDQYSEELLRSLTDSYCATFASMATARTVAELRHMTAAQQEALLSWNPGPIEDANPGRNVLDYFKENVAARPGDTALVYKDKKISFADVDRLSDNLAAEILRLTSPGGVVSIILGRNEWMMIAPLAALKAGCAYQPLDPSYPAERLNFMVKDASASLLIADPGLEKLVTEYEGPVIGTDKIYSLPEGKPEAPAPKPENLFILLYTSGTTGTPKGCQLTHGNVTAFGINNSRNLSVGPDSQMTAYASFGFDAFMGDLSTALVAGATLHVIPEEIRLDLAQLDAYFTANGITHSLMTTQVAIQFALNYPDNPSLKCLYTGGEKMPSIALPKYQLVNCYGPTESTCYVVFKKVARQEENVPIGKPLPGVHAYVVAKGGALLPVGAAGELLVSGPQVGPGYLGRPEKTAEVFIDNPYEDDEYFRHVYRTGDIVRYRADGDIEFIGRRDNQVKIRGFRIEPKEIETVIRDFSGITDVTVQAFDEKGGNGKFLAAYIVGPEPVDKKALADFIASRKPPYMVPAVIMQIDAIPLTVNQKVDRKALPEPVAEKHSAPAEAAPLNLLEQQLAELIAETVQIEGVGLTEPLYLYGLSSLSALRLATALYKKYGIQVDMNNFARTASLQTIENEVLKALLKGGAGAQEQNRAAAPAELTGQQTGIWFECMKAPHETFYNIPQYWTFPADLNPDTLRQAVLDVIRCHPYINTHFVTEGGVVRQVPVEAEPEVGFVLLKDEEIPAYAAGFVQPFELEKGPLYRINVVKTPTALHLFMDFHHTVFDGRSCDIFLTELTAALGGTAPKAEGYSYFNYAADQQSADMSAARDFFAGVMEGFEEPAALLPDLEPTEERGLGAYLELPVGADISERCKQLGISEASYCLAAVYLAASAFSGKESVYMCTVSNGRNDMRTSDTFGMFVNTLAISSKPGAGISVDEFLRRTDSDFSGVIAHEDYPFARLSSDFDFQPQMMYAYQAGILTEYKVNGQPLTGTSLEIGAPKFPLSIFVKGTAEEPVFSLGYDNSLYSPELIRSFGQCLQTVVRGLLADGPLEALPLSGPDTLKALDGFNAYDRKVDGAQTIVSLFRKAAAATPDALAVLFKDKQLSFKELDQRSERIAAYISSLGLGREGVVSILISRSELMAVTALGALKAGCAYQPLDPSYPAERLNFMIKDASAGLLIADDSLCDVLTEYDGPVLLTSQLDTLPEGSAGEGPAPENLFILLYTSGTTGVPKGCMLEHRNLVNFCSWYREYYGLKPGDRVGAYASFGFDACMMDMWPALTTGAAVCIVDEETRHDLSALDKFLRESGVTHCFMTTQVGVMYARNFPDNPVLKHLSVGGEKLVSMDPPSYAFHNGYGPTECTIFTTIFDVLKREANIPIGHPLGNLHLYVVDKWMRRMPAGAPGELLVSGPQVGRGYLGRPDKTAEVYVANPFCSEAPYDRVYRTGDIVRYRTDGNIEFVGRRDGQVKIRGFRVETKEVEAVIMEYPGVKEVTVQAFDSPSGGKFIAAYVVYEGKLDNSALGAFIGERKPSYMIPASINQIEHIPLNVNQKVDRKALPAPVVQAGGDYVEPVGETEKALCEIFARTLECERVGATDSFFDLGGTSLLVTQVLVKAEKAGLRFSYGDVFSHPTPRSLAAFLGGGEEGPADTDVASYDYSAINHLLEGNSLQALASGKPQPLGKRILLTGATGFLGIHLLRELLEHTGEDTEVWCLLRGKGALTAERRLSEMLVYYFRKNYRQLIGGRIKVVEGDITRPDTLAALEGQGIDMVLNSAANVKHFSKGTDIMDVNYGGVKNLVEFCVRTGARLVQVSTESVAGEASSASTMQQLTEQSLYFGQNVDNQYAHSKFLAERIILQNMAEGKLDAKIMRAGNLSPRAEDGEFQVNFSANSAMGRLHSFQLIGAFPYAMLEAKMEFSPIDETARAMVLLSETPRECCVFNVSNDHLLPFDDVVSRLGGVRYVEMEEFLQLLDVAKQDPDKARQLSALLAYAKSGSLESLGNPPSISYTMQVLHRLGFSWDQTSRGYVDMIFDMLRSLGYLHE